jgi:HAD superfamily hydrolase (TIGR01484 family)
MKSPNYLQDRGIIPVALFSDVDGVLGPYNSDTVSPYTPVALKGFQREMPGKVGLASGKSLKYLKEYCGKNGISPDFIIAENGGMISWNGCQEKYSNGGSVKMLRDELYSDRAAGRLKIPFMEEPEKHSIFTGFTDPRYVEDLRGYAEKRARKMGLGLSVIPHKDCIDIVPLGLNKAYAARRVSDVLGFDTSHAMAVGDGLNDLELLEEVGMPATVGNALPEVKDSVKSRKGILADQDHGEGVLEIFRYVFNTTYL